MAERRMFAKTIIDSDAFLDMPITSRLLYYDLGMRADDDGFVNSPKKIMRITGASQDDMGILISKKFIIPFESGVVVIKHWKIHNYIRKDAYTETKYKDEKRLLTFDENNAYSLACYEDVTNTSQVCDGTVTDMLQTCNETVTDVSTQDRLGKDRLGKDSLDKDSLESIHASVDTDASALAVSEEDELPFALPFASDPPKKVLRKLQKHKHGEYQHVLLTDDEYKRLEDDYGFKLDDMIRVLDEYIETSGKKYKNHNLVLRGWVKDRMEEQSRAKSGSVDEWYEKYKDVD